VIEHAVKNALSAGAQHSLSDKLGSLPGLSPGAYTDLDTILRNRLINQINSASIDSVRSPGIYTDYIQQGLQAALSSAESK